MVEKYVRSKDGLYPIIHHTFKAKASNSDNLVEYYVQDLTKDHIEKAIDFILKWLTPEETFQQAAKLSQNEAAVKVMRGYFKEKLEERVSLICFESGTNNLVGLTALTVISKGHEVDREAMVRELGIEELKVIMGAYAHVGKMFDVMSHFKVDHYLYGVGLCVSSDYRGRGIATELLKARVPLLKCLGLTVSSELFTTIGSQKATKHANYVEKSSVTYDEIKKLFPTLDFSKANTKTCLTCTLQIS